MGEGVVLCRLCASVGPTCCQGNDRDIYVTRGDVGRIATYCGHEGFHEFRRPSDPDYLKNSHDPVWLACVFRSDGTRRVLRKNGPDCLFLTTDGCSLPIHVRPLVCRLHPYDYDASGLRELFAGGCPTRWVPSGQTLGQCLGMLLPDVLRWHQVLYTELLLETSDTTVPA